MFFQQTELLIFLPSHFRLQFMEKIIKTIADFSRLGEVLDLESPTDTDAT